MKALFLIIFVGGISYATAQDIPKSQVPAEVTNALTSKFAKAKDVEWEMEGDLYKVEFEVGSRDHEMWIDRSGSIRRHREELSRRDLPQVITEKVKTEFQEYRIDDAHKVEDNGKIMYHIDLDGPGEDREVWFAEDGTVEQGL